MSKQGDKNAYHWHMAIAITIVVLAVMTIGSLLAVNLVADQVDKIISERAGTTEMVDGSKIQDSSDLIAEIEELKQNQETFLSNPLFNAGVLGSVNNSNTDYDTNDGLKTFHYAGYTLTWDEVRRELHPIDLLFDYPATWTTEVNTELSKDTYAINLLNENKERILQLSCSLPVTGFPGLQVSPTVTKTHKVGDKTVSIATVVALGEGLEVGEAPPEVFINGFECFMFPNRELEDYNVELDNTIRAIYNSIR